MNLTSIVGPTEIDLVALAVKERGVRCKTLVGGELVTLRPKHQIWSEVPGQILTVKSAKIWDYAGTRYMSGELLSARTDVKELDLVPLKLEDHGEWTPEDEYWGEPGEKIDDLFAPIIQKGPRPMYEMEQIIPGEDPEDPWEDPILEAVEFHECGEQDKAYKIMEKILASDLRCLDAHAHLGTWRFNAEFSGRDSIELAQRHYQIGVQIGELSLPDNFNGVLKWGMINNRPFLRCLKGYGLCLWRLGDTLAAKGIFERMLWLNPTDNQGIRFILAAINDGISWDNFEK